jgi:RNA polymerase sigma-70 factor (ECF subfamily)
MRDRRQRVWLALARRGNEDAFRRLYRELFDPVAGYVRRRVNNPEDAEDITAQVFRSFLQRLDRYDAEKGSVMTWVIVMARNAVIDHHRRVRPETADVNELADVLAGDHPEQTGPLHDLVRDEEVRSVQRLLARQPADIREMFALRFEQGMRVREVATVMGLGEDAVKQRFARTFRKLQLQLRDEEKGIDRSKGESPCAATD